MHTGGVARFLTPSREAKRALFDVVCVGEVPWTVARGYRVRPGGGAATIAVALRRRGLDVGLATALADDGPGRALVASIAQGGVDVGGVALSRSAPSLFVVDAKGDAQSLVAHRAESLPVDVPAAWAARLLVVSGLAPGVGYAASLCKAARAARRAGGFVVVDVNARWYAWAGRDPRAAGAVLREADLVRVDARDLGVLDWTEETARSFMRPSAVLVTTREATARVVGPFFEIAKAARRPSGPPVPAASDAFMGGLCAVLARAVDRLHLPDVWSDALQSGLGAHLEASARGGL